MEHKDYNVGLDIGVGSVGWAVIDDNYRLLHRKGKNLIGVNLFKGAETAAERRTYRTTRRRLARRHWRLGLLNDIFAPELAQQTGDMNFLRRLQYSWVHPDDQAMQGKYYQGSLFGDVAADKQFYQDYPTIYHLRNKLMLDDQQHDLREVYLAIHHLMKYRGNFLMPNAHLDLTAVFDVNEFKQALENFDPDATITDEVALVAALTDTQSNRTGRVENARAYVNLDKKIAKEVLNALVGLNFNFATMFMRQVEKDEAKAWKLSLADGEVDEKLATLSELVGDDALVSFMYQLKQAYDGLTLQMLLQGQASLSAAMIKRYQDHHDNWKEIKAHRNADNRQAVNAAYQALLSDNPEIHKKGLEDMLAALAPTMSAKRLEEFALMDSSNNFLPRQRTKDNGTIPVQLHEAELAAIIAKQSKYYPFLLATAPDENGNEQNKLLTLLKFRVPYYVGPMVAGTNATGRDQHNHWMVRKNNAQITPWNYREVIDTDESAKKFINAMISTDTYLLGEPALAKHTVTYESYNVLQELNNLRLNGKRLEVKVKQAIFNQVFKVNKQVTLADVKAFLSSNYGADGDLKGLADENKFNANLSSYHYLKKILGTEFVDDVKNQARLDEIITLQTVFEDSDILKRQLALLPDLSADAIAALAQKHFTGWGKLSAKLLQTRFIKPTKTSVAKVSILDLMLTTKHNLMEILNDTQYGVQDWLVSQNTQQGANETIDDLINQLAGPRNIKSAIKKSFNILLDIQKVMGGQAPKRIYLEFARDTQNTGRTRSRLNQLKRLYDQPEIKKEFKTLATALKAESETTLQKDKLYLYYTQLGRDFYSNEPINFDRLNDYDIDHIIPQAFTKDNSFDNRVLVNRADNNRKSDGNLDARIIDKCRGMWLHANKLGLISDRKLKRLLGEINLDKQTEHFVARQLVETRQIIKNVAGLAKQIFPGETKVQAVRAEMTGDMRRKLNIQKNRDVNDYHHAFDALLMATVGLYMDRRGIMQGGKLTDTAGNEFNVYTKQYLQRLRNQADNGQRIKPLGFVIEGMFSDEAIKRLNRETGEVVFDNVADVDYLRHVLAYKKILLTRSTRIDSGQFYTQNQVSNPKHSAKKSQKLIAVKANKPTELYGGFTSVASAYMTLVRVENKRKTKNVLVKVPIAVAQLIKSGQTTIEQYVTQEAKIKDFVKILIPVVKLDQLVEDHGERVYLTSSEYRHNAESLWLPTSLVNKVKMILASENVTLAEVLTLFDALTNEHVQKRMPIFAPYLRQIITLRDRFSQFTLAEQQAFLRDLLDALHPNNKFKSVIKKYFKDQKDWPNLQSQDTGNGGYVLSDNAVFIYQSPTGIYEKRVSISDLL